MLRGHFCQKRILSSQKDRPGISSDCAQSEAAIWIWHGSIYKNLKEALEIVLKILNEF
jgi:hypothetical protein